MALADRETAFEYIGEEAVEGQPAHHVRFWKTFSNPKLAHLAEFSARDVWISTTSGLPVKLSFVKRQAAGNADSFLIGVYFSDFRNVNGVLLPFTIKKSLNGTPWITLMITAVQFDTGLTEAAFSVR